MANLAPMPAEVNEILLKNVKLFPDMVLDMIMLMWQPVPIKAIQLANVTDYCAEEVSDQALAPVMSCVRKTARRDAQVRAGMWNIGSSDPIYRMAGKTFAFLDLE